MVLKENLLQLNIIIHAASAYFTQEKDCGLSITIDGGGEDIVLTFTRLKIIN